MQIIQTDNPSAIDSACLALSRGELVIYPTETCYGIAVDATHNNAVSNLLAYKGDRHRQVSIAVADRAMAQRYVLINEIADNLYTHFLPGPITVISESKHAVDQRLESTTGTLGVRIPKHDFALELIQVYGKPITATSANTSGKKEPYSLTDWQKYTSKSKQHMVALFLDAGKLLERPTSTVVDTTLNDPVILRQGELVLPSSAPTFTSTSPAATQEFAKSLVSRHLNLLHRYPLIIALQGELGAGKTVVSKGIAQALGITNTITSPTYTLLREYPFPLPKYSGVFYHLDTWRLADISELESTLHFSKLLRPGNIVTIEWAGKAKSYLDQYKIDYPVLLIDIKELDENTRTIQYSLSIPEWT